MITVNVRGEMVKVRKLLSESADNSKLSKSEGKGYLVYGLSLAPAKSSGYQVCPDASAGCIGHCLHYQGRARIWPRKIHPGRIAKTIAWFEHRGAFKSQLFREIRGAQKKAEKLGLVLVIRLNVFSDIPWETVFPEIFSAFPNVIFYDYTKSVKRALAFARGEFPKNYSLTFSRSEANEKTIKRMVRAGVNCAVVFRDGDFPAKYMGAPVIDGDSHDLRFTDPRGSIVALKAKGSAKRDCSGFVVDSTCQSISELRERANKSAEKRIALPTI